MDRPNKSGDDGHFGASHQALLNAVKKCVKFLNFGRASPSVNTLIHHKILCWKPIVNQML
jgi:hypothetical protein